MLRKILRQNRCNRFIKNKKGMAALEIIPVIIVAVLMVNYTLGMFGAVHTGILNSIASRNYTFETFRNRANVNWFRDTPGENQKSKSYFGPYEVRVSGTISENQIDKNDAKFVATTRSLAFVESIEKLDESRLNNASDHNGRIDSYFASGTKSGSAPMANPIWIRTRYGICLNHSCGGN